VTQIFRSGGLASLLVALFVCLGLFAQGVTEELGVGSVRGFVTMSENGRPLANALVILTPSFETPDVERSSRAVRTGPDGSFRLGNLAAGAYTVNAYSKAHALERAPLIVVEGTEVVASLELLPTTPYLELYAARRVFAPSEEAEMLVRGFAPESEARVTVFQVSFDAIVKARGLYRLLAPANETDPTKDRLGKMNAFRAVRDESRPIEDRDGEGVFDFRLKIGRLEEGVYWVRVRTGRQQRGAWFAVSRIGLVTKSAEGRTLAYVADIRSGLATAGATISALREDTLREVGRTGSDGIAEFATTPGEGVVVAAVGYSRAVCGVFGRETSDGPLTIQMYGDRPVYRPGDTVQFKGVVRQLRGGEYQLPGPGNVRLTVRGPDDEEVTSTVATLDDMGAFSSRFVATPDAVGVFSVTAEIGNSSQTRFFQVAAYRKPELKLRIKPDKPYSIFGERVRMRVECEYYFGGPVPGARVTANVYRAPIWVDPHADGEEEGIDESWLGDYLGETREIVADERGVAYLEFDPAQVADRRDRSWGEEDSRLTFLVTATENGQQFYEGRGTARLVRGEFALRVETDRSFVAPGGEVEAVFRAAEHDGDRAKAGVPLTVEFGRDNWTGRVATTPILETRRVTTGPDGLARVRFRVDQPGTYRVIGRARDGRGNRFSASAWFWSWNEGANWEGPLPDLDISLDKKLYRPGDSAMAVVRAKRGGGSALITLETDRVRWRKVVSLDRGLVSVAIPVDLGDAPNAFVGVTRVHDAKLSEASARMNVDLARRRLKVAIEPDRETLEPGQTVAYTITTSREDGTPVSADVALGVVDEAIYAIAEDRDDPVADFYPRRYSRVTTSYSFPELYLDGGDKGPVSLEARTDFRDTAYWNPSIRTGADGKATVAVVLPDNLTSWRATATAFSAKTEIGKGRANVRCRKPLMIRLATPAIITQSDRLTISATVTNDTGREQDVRVRLIAPPGLSLATAGDRTERVGSRPVTLNWDVTARAPGEYQVEAQAVASVAGDAVRIPVRVRVHGIPTVDYRAGTISDQVEFEVERPAGSSGGARLSLNPSLASVALDSLPELVDYPYGCVEQTMNRFMPAAVVAATLRDLGRRDAALEEKIAEVARRSMRRLRDMQNPQGGFGWFEHDVPEPGLTGLVLEGFALAKRAGLTIDGAVVQRALEASKRMVSEPPVISGSRLDPEEVRRQTIERTTARVFLAMGMLMHGAAPEALAALDQSRLDDLEAEGLAMLAIAYDEASDRGMRPDPARPQAAMDRLAQSGLATEGRLRWPSQYGFEPTARALDAYARLRPGSPEIPKIVRALTDARRGGGWASTRDTALALVGFCRVVRATGELQGAYTLRVWVNGAEKFIYQVESSNILAPIPPVEVAEADLAEGKNVVRIVVEGQGSLSYAWRSEFLRPGANLDARPAPEGVSVARTFHTLGPRRDERGATRLLPSRDAQTDFRSGELVRAIVKVSVRRPIDFVMVECPTPSNLRVVENESPEVWNAWWSSTKVLDDRVTFFARSLPAGDHVFEYNLRAENPGRTSALPPVLSGMYAPDLFARASEVRLEVRP
jgi:uncharacterized protein YfaS (alpha-2-macroglobulin family)